MAFRFNNNTLSRILSVSITQKPIQKFHYIMIITSFINIIFIYYLFNVVELLWSYKCREIELI